jgi:hypothetical protein
VGGDSGIRGRGAGKERAHDHYVASPLDQKRAAVSALWSDFKALQSETRISN